MPFNNWRVRVRFSPRLFADAIEVRVELYRPRHSHRAHTRQPMINKRPRHETFLQAELTGLGSRACTLRATVWTLRATMWTARATVWTLRATVWTLRGCPYRLGVEGGRVGGPQGVLHDGLPGGEFVAHLRVVVLTNLAKLELRLRG
eukprot:6257030-Pyramimonas_sp.AAC.1